MYPLHRLPLFRPVKSPLAAMLLGFLSPLFSLGRALPAPEMVVSCWE